MEARELTELIGTDPRLTAEKIADRIKHDADSDADLFVIQVSTAKGDVLFRSDNLHETVLSASLTPQHQTLTLPLLGRVHLSSFAVHPWLIQIGSPLEPSERLMRNYAQMCGLMIGVALVSVGLGYSFSQATLRPIRAIEVTARRIPSDNMSERIPVPSGRDELASLTNLLNQTFDRLQTSFEQVRRFTADVSHELKTPLALIRLNAEKLRPVLVSDADGSTSLADILEEVSRLEQVIDSLLFLARSERGLMSLPLRPVTVHALLSDFAEDGQALAEDRRVRFTLVRNEPGEIRGERDLLRQMLLNLVANAVSASPPGGTVTLESFTTDNTWRLEVTNEGPGLPEAQLGRVFERFVRFQPTTSTAEPRTGHGLGLAICKGIVELHEGQMRAENRVDRTGPRIIVALPVPPAV